MDGKKLEYKGEEALKEIEKLTKNADEVQESLLKQILTQNRETDYLNNSGTSAGEPKLMPSIAEDLDRRTFVYNLIMPIMNQLI
ncbi:hypothetical protein TSUD_38030 [Trifolium subterraneum]|uniref:Uncharacterized protein n=1 Tax=Trifolium subterraneum TaxID=3900 RepID=A0A2Z6NS03_TRISU|nr:hypothetical protein TSUD_38030 [Trifolium subterraneum]